NKRHKIALASSHFSVHEVILQLLSSTEPERPKPVAGPPIPDGQWSMAQIAAHYCNVAGTPRKSPRSRLTRGSDLCREDAIGLGQPHLPRNRQRITKKVRRGDCHVGHRVRPGVRAFPALPTY